MDSGMQSDRIRDCLAHMAHNLAWMHCTVVSDMAHEVLPRCTVLSPAAS
jgi:hypothetical protein